MAQNYEKQVIIDHQLYEHGQRVNALVPFQEASPPVVAEEQSEPVMPEWFPTAKQLEDMKGPEIAYWHHIAMRETGQYPNGNENHSQDGPAAEAVVTPMTPDQAAGALVIDDQIEISTEGLDAQAS
jgi:hypothetical protein